MTLPALVGRGLTVAPGGKIWPRIFGAPEQVHEEVTRMFEHEDAMTCNIAIEIEDAPQRVLLIETELQLLPTADDYDKDRVSALLTAAQAYKADKGNAIDKVRLVYVEYEDDDEDEDE